MMKRTLISSLVAGEESVPVRVCGWIDSIRDTKNMLFLVVRDHTGKVQVSLWKKGDPELAEQLKSLTEESAVDVLGELKSAPKVKLGGIEIAPSEVRVTGLAETPLPLNELSSLPHRLDWRFLDLRREEVRLIFEIQTTAVHAMREWWMDHGFLEMFSPKLMAHASEGGAELFELEYFGTTAALAQSPQFYKQMAMMAGYDRVCEIGPVFRANSSRTNRHDTEFTMVDMEISWVDSHHDVMDIEESWLTYVLKRVAEEHGDAIRSTYGIETVVPTNPFPRIPMAQALQILEEEKGHVPERDGDLDPKGERLLADWVMKNHGHEFVFVTDYPWDVRPFYHMRQPENPGLTRSFDLIWKGLEVTTGAQREHRLDVLTEQAGIKDVELSGIQFYLDFFRYGVPPHGGFGFGLSRMLMLLTGLSNVREVTYLYRGVTRLTP